MESLDGTWSVERVSGLLPPMIGVRKTIRGTRGETRIGRIPAAPFDVRGLELHYRAPFRASSTCSSRRPAHQRPRNRLRARARPLSHASGAREPEFLIVAAAHAPDLEAPDRQEARREPVERHETVSRRAAV